MARRLGVLREMAHDGVRVRPQALLDLRWLALPEVLTRAARRSCGMSWLTPGR